MVMQMATDDLVRARKRADINQQDLATELGISKRSLQHFEMGQRPLPRARSLADWYEAIETIKARRKAAVS